MKPEEMGELLKTGTTAGNSDGATVPPHHFVAIRNANGEPTWRFIPVSKWLVSPLYKPFSPFGRGTLLRALTNHGYYPFTKWDDPPSTGTVGGGQKLTFPGSHCLATFFW